MTIKFERTTYSVDEGDVVEVCAVLTGTLEKSVEVSVSSSSGSATGTHQILYTIRYRINHTYTPSSL